MFRTGTWVPGCLGGRSREAWAASSGSLGRIPGAPRGDVPAQCLRVVGGNAPLGFASKFIPILMYFWSFGGRSWIPFGDQFRSCWRLFRPKLVPEPSSNRLIFEKVILCEIVRFPILLGSSGSHMGAPKRPRSLQDGSLIVLDRFFSTLDFRFDFGSF